MLAPGTLEPGTLDPGMLTPGGFKTGARVVVVVVVVVVVGAEKKRFKCVRLLLIEVEMHYSSSIACKYGYKNSGP